MNRTAFRRETGRAPRRSVMTRSAFEWSLDKAIAEGRRAIRARKAMFVNVLVNRDALRVLVANTEIVRDALIVETHDRHRATP